MVCPIRVESLRPLVRYVDEHQAVIDTHFSAGPGLSSDGSPPPDRLLEGPAQVHVELDGHDGFHDEGQTRLLLDHGHGSVRFEVVRPELWWPAGMGEQALYELRISLSVGGEPVDQQSVTFGLTSVRRDRKFDVGSDPSLLINGQVVDVQDVLVIDQIHEQRLLPTGGASLLLVRDHYGPDLLYDAADRAGLLLIQCVPVDAQGTPDHTIERQIDRLSAHPSLIGYFVGHLGDRTDAIAARIRQIDPTRSIFHHFPLTPPEAPPEAPPEVSPGNTPARMDVFSTP